LARRYTKNRRQSEKDTVSIRKHIEPERVASNKPSGIRRPRFNILLIAVVIIIAYFALEPLINKTPVESQQVIQTGDTSEIVSFPIISEVMSSNRNALAAEDGEYYDWIELYNPTQSAINLNGFALTDDINEPAKFVMTSYVLGPGEFVVFFASGKAIDNKFHASFKISSEGETLYLADPYSNIKDQVYVDHMSPNFSYQRQLATLEEWTVSEKFSPGFFNDEGGYQEYLATLRAYDSTIKINEIMSSNLITLADEDGDYSDWAEITNTGSEAIDISGYAMSDNESTPREWLFPQGTVLNPGEYLVVFLSGKDKVGKNGELHANFRLNSMNDTLLCANIQGKIVDLWGVPEPGDDVSIGIDLASSERVYMTHPTPGYVNSEDGYNQFQQDQSVSQQSGVVLSEIMLGNETTLKDNFDLNPDWIEIYNNTEEKIMLGGYGLSDSSSQLGKWKFPDGAFIDPGAYKIVYASGMDTPTDSPATSLHTNFSLDLAGEPVILTNTNNEIIDKCVLSPMPYDISYGRTIQSNIFEYMVSPTPGEENSDGYSGIAPTPHIPLKGGVYADPQVIVINVPVGCTVRYTLDCSEPTDRDPIYEGPFQVEKTTIVRARAFQAGKIDSNIATQTYLIGLEHKLPIVSISTDPNNLTSDHAGILAFGDDYSRKYPFKGANFYEDWEVAAHLEMYEIDGSQVLSQGFGLRVFGAYSRAEIAKNFALIAREKYGDDMFSHAIFPERSYKEYKSIIIRNGASEWYASKIVDSTLTSLAQDTTDLDVQSYYPVVFYLNGEYWGVYFLREKINKYYLQQKYGIDPEKVDIIYGNGIHSSNAVTGDNENWLALRDFVMTHDLSVQENYVELDAWIDIQNYMDMVINEIYVGNTDTGNIKCYREKVEGAKWRWFYYDVDWSFANESANSLKAYLNPEGHGNGDGFETWLILGLMENESFKQAFIERFAYHVNVTYDPDRVLDRIDQIVAQIDYDMQTDREVWRERFYETADWYRLALGGLDSRWMSYEKWSTGQISRRKNFAQKRPDAIKLHLKDYFDLTDEEMARLFDY